MVLEEEMIDYAKEAFRQIEIDCDCGNHLSATVFSVRPFDLTCSKCGKHFVEDNLLYIVR